MGVLFLKRRNYFFCPTSLISTRGRHPDCPDRGAPSPRTARFAGRNLTYKRSNRFWRLYLDNETVPPVSPCIVNRQALASVLPTLAFILTIAQPAITAIFFCVSLCQDLKFFSRFLHNLYY